MLSLLSSGSVIRLMSPFTSFLCLLIRVSSYLLLDEDVVVEISEHELVIIVEEFGAALVEHHTADRDVDFLGDADAGLLRSFLPLARHFGLLHSDERHTEVIAVFITVSSFCCSFSMEYQTNLWDITLGVSLGSATQISMFVVPLCVMVAWITGIKMDLDLNLLETGSLIMAILVIAFTLQDGTSHYLKGLVPLLCYLAIGACFFVFKSPLELYENDSHGIGHQLAVSCYVMALFQSQLNEAILREDYGEAAKLKLAITGATKRILLEQH
ncbi:hypothetical protein ZIOFF_024586 [Zingiber officinale]|uniref:Sodium/calcium exchanger membrane region domain-containing protein n=1 Tax=Zingiber officinale TaxID=94328 RepID=A0A8J5H8S9_ZINOF|nr:hypothetical protein ZIOFF_024586 [Zingiber officinale]